MSVVFNEIYIYTHIVYFWLASLYVEAVYMCTIKKRKVLFYALSLPRISNGPFCFDSEGRWKKNRVTEKTVKREEVITLS